MRYNRNVLFTTNWGVQYDNWIPASNPERIDGFYNKFTRGTDVISVSTPVFYLLVKIEDKNGKVLYYDYIRTIDQYKAIKKKLCWK